MTSVSPLPAPRHPVHRLSEADGRRAPERQIRARYGDDTISVYQAYRPEIGDGAVRAQTFVPPFSRSRMTWIKPSFAWMMYRCGWGDKEGQERVLRIEITREGFEWALGHACLSSFHAAPQEDHEAWRRALRASPVRVQWDPERTLLLEPLPWRSIQIGLGPQAVEHYVDRWIVGIEEVTATARAVRAAAVAEDDAAIEELLPVESPYPLPEDLSRRLDATG